MSISLPLKGAAIPANNPNIATKYPPEPAFIFNAFSAYCGTNTIPIIPIPTIKDKISTINILGFKKYSKLKIGSLALFSINMKIGISTINVNKYG